MPKSQNSNKADARKTKEQLILELRSVRRQLTTARRKVSAVDEGTKEKALQIKFDEISQDHWLLSKIIDIASDGIISIDRNQNIIRYSKGTQQIFGYDHEQLIGKPLDLLLPSQFRVDHKTFAGNFCRSESDGELANRRGEITGRRQDGTTFPARVIISTFAHDGVVTTMAIVRDISEIRAVEKRNKRTHEELAHVGRVNILGEISGSLAHELNQPLTAILANAQALQSEMPPSTNYSVETIDSISDIIVDAKRAGEIIRRIRSLSERRKYRIESVDINKLIVETEIILRSQLVMSQLHVELDLDPSLPPVPCDPIQMQQVILNIMANAIDATAMRDPSDRHVLIRTYNPNPNVVEFSIRDSGAGFDNEPYQSLLKSFFTTKEHGLGMGLAVSKSILQKIGGRLWAHNNDGPGATFYISLPLPRKGTVPEDQQKHETKPVDSNTELVFVVDDDASIRKSMRRLIRSAGYAVELYESAEHFKQRDAHVGVGCIVVDLHMPGASGLDLQTAIRDREFNLPMIFITGGGDTASGVRAMKDGASDFLSKPVDEERLLRAVALALEKCRVMRTQRLEHTQAQQKIAKLTPRETEILGLVVKGMRNKQIAGALEITEKTVKVHRGHVMKKVGARTVADLVRLAAAATVDSSAPQEGRTT